MDQLRLLTDELRLAREQFEPIYTYYFPKSWLVLVARVLRLAKQPDFSLHLSDLKQLHDRVLRCSEDAKKAFVSIDGLAVDHEFKQMAELGYRQISFDVCVIVHGYKYICGMHDNDPECWKHFMTLKDCAKKAQQNLVKMGRMADGLR